MSIIAPNNNPELIINDFILYATSHLSTVSGVINTISLYPGPAAPVPGPGIILWTGYQITPSSPPVPKLDPSVVQMNDTQLAFSTLGSLDGLSINDATSLTFESDLNINDPQLDLQQVDLTFDNSLDPNPIPDIEDTELTETNDETDTDNEDNKEPERIPNYKTNIKVPDEIVLAMRRWGIAEDDPLERAHFLSQCAHESGGWKFKSEIWGPTAAQSGYEGRTDLGNTQAGDGFKFRGRGYIQLTGRANYKKAELVLKGDIVNNPDYVKDKYPGDSACYFWTSNKLKRYCIDDSDDSIKKLTKRINGGQNGLPDRKAKFKVYWNELQKDNTLWT